MIIIDVRTKEEFDMGAVPNALHHDIMEMMEGRFPVVPRDEKIVLYCESGNRAMMAEQMMKDAGYTDVTNGGSLEECLVLVGE